MNFCWVTLPVSDLETSLAFYHNVLGLPIDSKHSGNGIEMAMLGRKNQPKIELICMPNSKDKTLHSDISIGIAVESMEDAQEFLKNNRIPIVRGPVSPAPNTCFLFVHDPDGYEVQLVEMKK
jgi:lactoylglutathione lyase